MLKDIFQKYKGMIILTLVLWVLLFFIIVVPFTYANSKANFMGQGLEKKMEYFTEAISKNPFKTIDNLKVNKALGDLFKNFAGYTLIYAIFAVISIIKAKPKSEYDKIEHGSSDWSENGAQYKILNKKEGIVLAEKNYLPVDKKGNLNVLIVGRIWFW